MATNITTLALNLLISERASHRKSFASKIIDLTSKISHDSDKDKEVLNSFLAALNMCVENPGCELRDLFYQFAQFYNKKISAKSNLSAAA